MNQRRVLSALCGKWGIAFFIGAASLATACDSKEKRMFDEASASCTDGELPACALLGEYYAKGLGTAPNEAKASQIFQAACDRGNRRACLLLGNAYAAGRGVPRDPTRAGLLLGQACEFGEEDACRDACDVLGDAARCLRVGVLSANGSRDPHRAAAYYEKACDRGHPLGCKEVATMYRDGVGVEKNADRAAELWKRADTLMRSACDGPTRPEYCEL
jgi:TPR repeat protein